VTLKKYLAVNTDYSKVFDGFILGNRSWRIWLSPSIPRRLPGWQPRMSPNTF